METHRSDISILMQSLIEFEKTLNSFAKPLLDKLEPGGDSYYIREFLSRLKIDDSNLMALYNWKNGIKDAYQYKITEFDLCSFGKFMSMEPTVSLYLALKASRTHSKFLFPIMTTLGGDFLFYDLNKKSKNYGMLLIYSPAILITKPETAFDGLSNFFDCMSKCYQTGVYSFDQNTNHLTIHFEEEHKLCKQLNPKSKYWTS